MEISILRAIEEAVSAFESLKHPKAVSFIERAVYLLLSSFRAGHKILIAGNGGSLCDAMHFAEELTGFLRKRRPPLPAICLSDPAHLTCVSNDIGYEWVFSRAVEAFGKKGDVLIILTTSGNSPNLIRAVSAAKSIGLNIIGFLGKGGGKLKGECDLEWIMEGSPHSDRIQEVQMAAIHIIIDQIECELF